MVQINVSQMLKESIGSTREYEINSEVDIRGNGPLGNIRGEVKLTRTNRGILVQGTVYVEIELWCSRCLSSFDHPLVLRLEEEYFPVIDVKSGLAVSLPEEPGSLTIDTRHILDLTEAIRQNALLAIPMKPLCRADCAGLCPVCGYNNNIERCECQLELNNRWAKLRNLGLTDSCDDKGGTE